MTMRHQAIRYLALGTCAFVGALLLHCGGQLMDSDGGGGIADSGVPDANAQTTECCRPRSPSFVVLGQGTATGAARTPAVALVSSDPKSGFLVEDSTAKP